MKWVNPQLELQDERISPIQLVSLQKKTFPIGFKISWISQPISSLLVMTKRGSSCCKLHLKAPREDEEETEKASASLAA